MDQSQTHLAHALQSAAQDRAHYLGTEIRTLLEQNAQLTSALTDAIMASLARLLPTPTTPLLSTLSVILAKGRTSPEDKFKRPETLAGITNRLLNDRLRALTALTDGTETPETNAARTRATLQAHEKFLRKALSDNALAQKKAELTSPEKHALAQLQAFGITSCADLHTPSDTQPRMLKHLVPFLYSQEKSARQADKERAEFLSALERAAEKGTLRPASFILEAAQNAKEYKKERASLLAEQMACQESSLTLEHQISAASLTDHDICKKQHAYICDNLLTNRHNGAPTQLRQPHIREVAYVVPAFVTPQLAQLAAQLDVNVTLIQACTTEIDKNQSLLHYAIDLQQGARPHAQHSDLSHVNAAAGRRQQALAFLRHKSSAFTAPTMPDIAFELLEKTARTFLHHLLKDPCNGFSMGDMAPLLGFHEVPQLEAIGLRLSQADHQSFELAAPYAHFSYTPATAQPVATGRLAADFKNANKAAGAASSSAPTTTGPHTHTSIYLHSLGGDWID